MKMFWRLRSSSRRSLAAAASVFGIIISGEASGQNCPDYVGQTVSPLNHFEALRRLPRIAPRGEFETSAEYETRRREALSQIEPLVIAKALPDRRNDIPYDADSGRFEVTRYAFESYYFDRRELGPQYRIATDPAPPSVFGVVLSSVDTDGDARGFGRDTHGLIEQVEGSEPLPPLFPAELMRVSMMPRHGRPAIERRVLGYIPMAAGDAERVSAGLGLAFAILPKEGPHLGRRAFVFRNSSRPNFNFTGIYGDIRCALVLDRAAKVLAAFDTN